jgi:anti-anti-sigma factor
MKIDVTRDKNVRATVRISGNIDSGTVDSLKNELQQFIQKPPQSLVLDMAEVSYISSAGVGLLVKTKASMLKLKCEMGLVNVQPQIRKAFEIMHLLPALSVFQSVQELDNYLAKIQRRIIEEGSATE